MTPHDKLLVTALLAPVIWLMWMKFLAEFRCRYCGGVGAHKQDCPYDLNREER